MRRGTQTKREDVCNHIGMPSNPAPEFHGAPSAGRMPATRRLAWLIVIAALIVAGGVAFYWASNRIGVAPRRLGPWLEQRSAGHDRAIVYISDIESS